MGATISRFPAVSDELVKALDKAFPDRCPDPSNSEREIWMRVGERRAVEFLMAQHRKQQQANLLTE